MYVCIVTVLFALRFPGAKSSKRTSEPASVKPASVSTSVRGSSVSVKTHKHADDDDDVNHQLRMDSSLKFPKEGWYFQIHDQTIYPYF